MTNDEAQVQIEGMNRTELRAACKAAGIQYSKLDTNAMRGALIALLPQEETQAAPVELTPANVREHNCPGCGIGLENGVLHADDELPNRVDGRTFWMDGMNKEFECMGCGHQFGKDLEAYVAPTPGVGVKIEKNRPQQNGVTRPSAGGKCRAVWDALDAFVASNATSVAGITSKQVKSLAEANGFNANNASIEFYQWRKYNGVTGRAAKE